METAQIVNVVANFILTLGITAFMIFVFGRSSMMHTLTWFERNFIKAALAISACGALESVLTLANPPASDGN